MIFLALRRKKHINNPCPECGKETISKNFSSINMKDPDYLHCTHCGYTNIAHFNVFISDSLISKSKEYRVGKI